MTEKNKKLPFVFLFFFVFVLGLTTAYIRLEIVYLNTKRLKVVQDLEQSEFKRRYLNFELSKIKKFQKLKQNNTLALDKNSF